jgi:serine/threonine protein kinase
MSIDAAAEEQFGPYLVYERLGVGGMATVHRALEQGADGFERMVALKRLLPHLAEDASFIKAFVREAKLASILNHLNIVQIYELGRVGTAYFISMEYIDGRDLRRILRHARKVTGPPPIHVTAGLIMQLCDALDYAHNKVDDEGHPLGLVHRDISPSNLLVTSGGHLKIIDFGIAKAQSSQLRTQTGRVKGKLAYMAPEAVSGSRDLDARSDIWAAGVILHELLTARPLFASKNEYQTLLKVQRGDIMPPSTFNQGCPLELDAIVSRALARDPDERFASAGELREALSGLERQYALQTGYRDIAGWLDWAFGLEAPGGFSANPTTGVGVSSSTPRRQKTPRPQRNTEEDEAVEVVWGGGNAESEDGPVVLEDVPDVSDKHLRPKRDTEDDSIADDDIPTPLPSHGTMPSIYAEPASVPHSTRDLAAPVARGSDQMRAQQSRSGPHTVPRPITAQHQAPRTGTGPQPAMRKPGEPSTPPRATRPTSPGVVAKSDQLQAQKGPNTGPIVRADVPQLGDRMAAQRARDSEAPPSRPTPRTTDSPANRATTYPGPGELQARPTPRPSEGPANRATTRPREQDATRARPRTESASSTKESMRLRTEPDPHTDPEAQALSSTNEPRTDPDAQPLRAENQQLRTDPQGQPRTRSASDQLRTDPAGQPRARQSDQHAAQSRARSPSDQQAAQSRARSPSDQQAAQSRARSPGDQQAAPSRALSASETTGYPRAPSTTGTDPAGHLRARSASDRLRTDPHGVGVRAASEHDRAQGEPRLSEEELFGIDAAAALARVSAEMDAAATKTNLIAAPHSGDDDPATPEPTITPVLPLPVVPVVRFSRSQSVPPANQLPALVDPSRPPPQTKPGIGPARAQTAPRTKAPSNIRIGESIAARGIKPSRTWLVVVAGIAIAGAGAAAIAMMLTGDPESTTASEPEPTPAPTKSGTVRFMLEPPDAEIRIGGQPVHAGSPWHTELAAGVHQIEIHRNGYKSWLTSLELSAAETQTLRVVLEPLSANTGDASLRITTTPSGLEVFIDGKLQTERTPFKSSLKPGAHEIAIRQDGVEVWQQSLTAEASSDYEFNPSFTADKLRERAQRTPRPSADADDDLEPMPSPSRTTEDPRPEPVKPAPATSPAPTPPIDKPTIEKAKPEPTAKPPEGAKPTPPAPAITKPAPPTPAPPAPTAPPPAPKPSVTTPVVPAPSPAPAPVAIPRKPGAPVIVPPNVVKKLSGDPPSIEKFTNVELPANVAAKVCIDEAGKVTSADIVTKVPSRVATDLAASLRSWRYAPHKINGAAVSACFVVTFRVK